MSEAEGCTLDGADSDHGGYPEDAYSTGSEYNSDDDLEEYND